MVIKNPEPLSNFQDCFPPTIMFLYNLTTLLSCSYQGRKLSSLEVTLVLLSGLDDCMVTVHWLWSWDANVLLCSAQSLSILESNPLLAANTLTVRLSQWFRKSIYYWNKKPNGVAGTDKKPSANWQIAFYVRLALGSFREKNFYYPQWKPMHCHKTLIPNRKKTCFFQAESYIVINEWMNEWSRFI